MTNHLANEKSPYLLQHAGNPVEWHPWNEEALARARAEEKPIFLSVGYSTCHWCHVMERESFAVPEVAEVMNRHFINIKVDREERPDVDRVYMTFVQATTGSGGWPMSVWLTPDLQPFLGGTYFPPEDRYGRPGFVSVLNQVAQLWKERREELIQRAGEMVNHLRGKEEVTGGEAGAELARKTLEQLQRNYDPEWGGFGGAPKFPRPVSLQFLFSTAWLSGLTKEERAVARQMALHTLERMSFGGMHDHLGGGFHRYSVDATWHVPHFEKMLYDQAQLLEAYRLGWMASGRFRQVAADLVEYLRRDLTSPQGGFYSAEDADSSADDDPSHHGEGLFYLWTPTEIEEVIGAEGARFITHLFGVRSEGNAPPGSDPHGEFTGKNILMQTCSPMEAATHSNVAEGPQQWPEWREALRKQREQRPRPHLDDKVITAWNGLMISALARAGATPVAPEFTREGWTTYTPLPDLVRRTDFDQEHFLPEALPMAEAAAGFVLRELRHPESGRLLRTWRGEPGDVEAFAEDYAFFISGLLDLYTATWEMNWLREAIRLQEEMDARFYDTAHGGYFATSGDQLPLRLKEDYDGAEPAANSVAVGNLRRLGRWLDREKWLQQATATVQAFGSGLERMPVGAPLMALEASLLREPPRQLILVGSPSDTQTQALLREVIDPFHPACPLLVIDRATDEPPEAWRALIDASKEATAFLCEGFVCHAPTSDPEELRRELLKAGLRPAGPTA